MENYKKMYYHLAHAVEEAIRLLIQAQQECEEIYLEAPPELFPSQDAAED